MSLAADDNPEQGRGPYVTPSFTFIDQPWADQAVCAQTDPESFFPEKGGSTRQAKAVCAQCFVQAECLDYALTADERFGVWGGLSERERRALKQPGPVSCTHPGCDRRFASKTAHDQHFRIVHRPPTTLLACPDCTRSFAQPNHLANHARLVHPDTERTVS
jgi:WhiB family redox-sensing transcriptional regulator